MRLQGKTALIAGASRNIGKAIALTFAREGANLIAVGLIETARRNPEWYPEKDNMPFTRSDVKSVPLGRTGTPQEVANVALFLASEESSYVTGDRIVCAGGRYM